MENNMMAFITVSVLLVFFYSVADIDSPASKKRRLRRPYERLTEADGETARCIPRLRKLAMFKPLAKDG